MALPKIDPLNTEFDMPQSGGNDVQREITKLGEVIIDKTSAGLKAAYIDRTGAPYNPLFLKPDVIGSTMDEIAEQIISIHNS